MRVMRFMLQFCGLILATFIMASAAQAQASRTWVSGVGDDVNPCSRTAPCKTFAGAISKTAAGGVISVLDPGGYGAVTVTKSITLDGTGTLASILNAGTAGVIVNNAGAKVILRNIDIDGAGTGGTFGVRVLAATSLHLENVTISNITMSFARAIDFSPSTPAKLFLKNVTVSNAGTGTSGGGLVVVPSASSAVSVTADNFSVFNSTYGAVIDTSSAGTSANVTLRNSTLSGSTLTGLLASSAASSLSVALDNVVSANNATGVAANGAAATVRMNNSTITGSTIRAIQRTNGGVVESFGNNQVFGNNNPGQAPAPIAPMSIPGSGQ